MKDTLSIVKKRVLKEVEITLTDGMLQYKDAEMSEFLPLNAVFNPFLEETVTITIVNKNESDEIDTETIEE
jgi:hypothetical protein